MCIKRFMGFASAGADAVLPRGTRAKNMSFRGSETTVGIHFINGKLLKSTVMKWITTSLAGADARQKNKLNMSFRGAKHCRNPFQKWGNFKITANKMDCDASLRCARNDMKYKCAFTLAEILTTLTIIGVIAVITIPAMNSDISGKVSEKQKVVFEKKFNQALHVMQLKGELAKQYESTEDFVNTMSKYMNITHICKSDNLDGCFAPKIMQDKRNVKYNLSTFSSSSTSENVDIRFSETSDLVSLVFGDGTRALISYDKNCLIEDTFNQNADVTACLGMYYDINGNDMPNILNKDILTINVGERNTTDYIGEIFTPICLTQEDCNIAKAAGAPIESCSSAPIANCRAGAINECYTQGKKLPSTTDMQKIGKQLYDQTPAYAATTPGLTIVNQDLAQKLNLASGGAMYFWSTNSSYLVYFGQSCAQIEVASTNYCVTPNIKMGTDIIPIAKAFCIDK